MIASYFCIRRERWQITNPLDRRSVSCSRQIEPAKTPLFEPTVLNINSVVADMSTTLRPLIGEDSDQRCWSRF